MGLLDDLYGLLAGMSLFFISFNFLEASLPAMVSRQCSEQSRGTAMGVYSTSQFSGAFIGGILSGYLVQLGDPQMIFIVLAALAVLWLIAVLGMSPSENLS